MTAQTETDTTVRETIEVKRVGADLYRVYNAEGESIDLYLAELKALAAKMAEMTTPSIANPLDRSAVETGRNPNPHP